MWDVACLILVVGILIIEAYSLGLKNGQKLKNEEKITTIAEPVTKVIESRNNPEPTLSKEAQIEWENINNFDGTTESQKSIE
jgi:hypothetical protein